MRSSLLPLQRMRGFGMRRKRRVRRVRLMAGGRKMKLMGGQRKRRYGRGIFDTIKNLAGKAFNIARSVPIISTGLKLAGQNQYGDVAKSLGFGRLRRVRRTRKYGGRKYGGRKKRMSVYGGARMRKRMFSVFGGRRKKRYVRRTRRGRGLMDLLKKGHNLVKQHGLVSKGLSLFGKDKYANIAKSLGYGRKRKRTRRGGFMRGFMGAIPLALNRGLGRRRRIKRTYPSGLFTSRRS